MNKIYKIDDVQYVSVIPPFDRSNKELSVLWAMMQPSTMPLMFTLRAHPCNTSPNNITKLFVNAFNDITSASKRARVIAFMKQFFVQYPKYRDDEYLSQIPLMCDYEMELCDITNASHKMPDKTMVWDLNHLSPQLCGMFFETIVTYVVIGPRAILEEANDMDILESPTSTYAIDDIYEMLKNVFSLKLPIKDIYINQSEELNINVFIWLSMKHFLKKSFDDGDIYIAAKEFIKYFSVDYNKRTFDEYIKRLSAMNLMNSIRKNHPQHGIRYEYTNGNHHYSGIVDFITDNSIIDIKVYKDEHLDEWFAQLHEYNNLISVNDIPRKVTTHIINLYNNKRYTFREVSMSVSDEDFINEN